MSKTRSRLTTLEELVEFSSIPLADRPIVNALDLPLTPGCRPEQNFPFSDEFVAWVQTLRNRFCFGPYPTKDTRWNLVALNGALHYSHIDSDGFGTWIEVKHGLKLWAIIRPKDGTVSSFNDIDGILNSFGGGDEPKDDWIVEAVVLKPGDRL